MVLWLLHLGGFLHGLEAIDQFGQELLNQKGSEGLSRSPFLMLGPPNFGLRGQQWQHPFFVRRDVQDKNIERSQVAQLRFLSQDEGGHLAAHEVKSACIRLQLMVLRWVFCAVCSFGQPFVLQSWPLRLEQRRDSPEHLSHLGVRCLRLESRICQGQLAKTLVVEQPGTGVGGGSEPRSVGWDLWAHASVC